MTAIHRIPCPIPFPLKTVNCYYIDDSQPTLIDTGIHTPGSIDCIAEAIHQRGGDAKNIRRIILTHAHTDHAGLAGRLAELYGAEVFIHRFDHPKFISGDRQVNAAYFQRFQNFLQFCGVPESQAKAMTDGFVGRVAKWVTPLPRPNLLSGGETFAFDDFALRVIHTPGHTAGSISLLNEADGELFSGDTLLENITPNPVAEISPPDEGGRYLSIPSYAASLQQIGKLNLRRVRPGHGPPFSQARGRTAAILAHFDQRKQLVLQQMAPDTARPADKNGPTIHLLADKMFPNLNGIEIFLGLSEIYAYVQLLESESRIHTWQDKGVCHFQLKT